MKNWLAKCHVLSYWKSEAFQRVIEDEMSPRRGGHTRGDGMRNAFLCLCGAASSRVNASRCVSTLFPWSCWQCVDVLALFNEQISGLTREDNEKQHCGEGVRVPKQLFEFSAPCSFGCASQWLVFPWSRSQGELIDSSPTSSLYVTPISAAYGKIQPTDKTQLLLMVHKHIGRKQQQHFYVTK